ncbi:MAG TPA: hypothetical protein VMU08_07780 [Rhizomicrobium sp.]|nr:hypothetical protein [Rhizomicrobium sp.]
MRRVLLAAAAVVAFATAARADDPFAVAYGNTVTETLPDGTKIVIYVNPDMTWQQAVAGHVTKGTYAWKDATHVCFTVTDPAPADPSKATACNEIKGDHKVGDSWTEQTPDGKTITMMITAGRT